MIPMALPVADPQPLLAMPLDGFLSSAILSSALRHAVRTVASIRAAKTVGAFCDSEVDGLLCNRFSPKVAEDVRLLLYDWLLSHADDHELDEIEDDFDSAEGTPAARTVDGLGESRVVQSRQSLPPIEAPPATADLLGEWAGRYGVRDRLADRIHTDQLLQTYYGLQREGLPETVGEAALVHPEQLRAPASARRGIASNLVSFAKAYLHRAAQAAAMASRQEAEHAARARMPGDPLLLQLMDLVQGQRSLLATDARPRPAGTYLPGRIYLDVDQLSLTYYEWSPRDGCTPGTSDNAVFEIFLSGWDSGSLRLQCLRCRESLACPHLATALDRVVAALRDPEDSLAKDLLPILRVPSWARLLEHLDREMVKPAPAADDKQRLVWELSDQPGGQALLPVLQKVGKRGAWSRGQRLRLDELEYKSPLLTDAADKATFEALRDARDRHAYSTYAPQSPRQLWRGLATLVGSNRLFADPTRSAPISVRKVRPALKVDPADQGFRLRFLLGTSEVDAKALLDQTKDEHHVIWLQAEHHRCLLALVDQDAVALLSAMARFPGVMPAEAVGELLDRLRRTQATLDLHLPESVRGERVEPPSKVVCRLEPLSDAGLSIGMVVRPIEGGPTFAPGDGPPEIFHARDGRRVHAVRPMPAERERAAYVAEVLGLDDTTAGGAFRWELGDDEAALTLLGKLRDIPDLVEVEWPAGEIRVASVSRGALKVAVRKRRDWFGAEGGVEIEGTHVALVDLLAAIRAGRRYVKLDKHRFAAIEEDLRERLSALDDVVFDNQGAIELGILAAPVLADLVSDPRQLDLTPAFRAILGKLEAARTAPPVLPAGLAANLRHYQDDGFRWLARLSEWGLGACLADDMGLG